MFPVILTISVTGDIWYSNYTPSLIILHKLMFLNKLIKYCVATLNYEKTYFEKN